MTPETIINFIIVGINCVYLLLILSLILGVIYVVGKLAFLNNKENNNG